MELSPTELRHNVSACVTTEDLIAVVNVVKNEALLGDIKAAALLLRHCDVLPGRRCQPVGLDEGQLETIEGCLSASQDIFRELAAGNLDHESAASLGAVVDRAMRAHQLKQGERSTEALENMGSQIVFAEAGRMEESLREIGAAMDKQKGATDAD